MRHRHVLLAGEFGWFKFVPCDSAPVGQGHLFWIARNLYGAAVVE